MENYLENNSNWKLLAISFENIHSELSLGIKRSSYTLSGDKSTKAFSNNNIHFRENFPPFCCRVMLFALSEFSLQNFGELRNQYVGFDFFEFLQTCLEAKPGQIQIKWLISPRRTMSKFSSLFCHSFLSCGHKREGELWWTWISLQISSDTLSFHSKEREFQISAWNNPKNA